MRSRVAIGVLLQVPLYTITWIARVLIFVGPFVAFVVTRRICIGLQRKDRDELLHGHRAGEARRHVAAGSDGESGVAAGAASPPQLAPGHRPRDDPPGS